MISYFKKDRIYFCFRRNRIKPSTWKPVVLQVSLSVFPFKKKGTGIRFYLVLDLSEIWFWIYDQLEKSVWGTMLWCTMLWWVYGVKGLINSQNGSIIKGDIYVYEKLVELTYITQSQSDYITSCLEYTYKKNEILSISPTGNIQRF